MLRMNVKRKQNQNKQISFDLLNLIDRWNKVLIAVSRCARQRNAPACERRQLQRRSSWTSWQSVVKRQKQVKRFVIAVIQHSLNLTR